jgi:hypothetical protein
MPRPKKGERVPGSGKKKGFKAPHTLQKLEARELVRQLVTRELEPMISAQIAHAKGIDHFFLRDEKTKQFKRIEDPLMIEAALNAGDRDAYYWIFTKDPSVQAFSDLLNRAIDKPKEQTIDVNVEGDLKGRSDAEVAALVAAILPKLNPSKP